MTYTASTYPSASYIQHTSQPGNSSSAGGYVLAGSAFMTAERSSSYSSNPSDPRTASESSPYSPSYPTQPNYSTASQQFKPANTRNNKQAQVAYGQQTHDDPSYTQQPSHTQPSYGQQTYSQHHQGTRSSRTNAQEDGPIWEKGEAEGITDPALLREGVGASMKISGTPGDRERLDPST
jgi:hypothetical protein